MQNYAKSKNDSYRYMFKKLLECFTDGLKLLHLYHAHHIAGEYVYTRPTLYQFWRKTYKS